MVLNFSSPLNLSLEVLEAVLQTESLKLLQKTTDFYFFVSVTSKKSIYKGISVTL